MKTLTAIVLAVSAYAQAPPPPRSDCDASAYLAPGHVAVPCLDVPSIATGMPAHIDVFTTAAGDKAFGFDTEARLSYDPSNATLNVAWSNLGDMFLKNTYSKCNSDMWNQEVVEIFLGIIPTIAPLADPTHYIEIEITPHNALFVNNISNPFTNGTAKTNTAIDCGASGIVHSAATFSSESSWTAELSIPLNLAFGSGYTPKAGDLMRVNIFRVVMENDVDACDDSSCAFGCWSSTDTSPSAFHHSNHFGVLRFV